MTASRNLGFWALFPILGIAAADNFLTGKGPSTASIPAVSREGVPVRPPDGQLAQAELANPQAPEVALDLTTGQHAAAAIHLTAEQKAPEPAVDAALALRPRAAASPQAAREADRDSRPPADARFANPTQGQRSDARLASRYPDGRFRPSSPEHDPDRPRQKAEEPLADSDSTRARRMPKPESEADESMPSRDLDHRRIGSGAPRERAGSTTSGPISDPDTSCSPARSRGPVIHSPREDEVVIDRREFDVLYSVRRDDETSYWLSIAPLRGDGSIGLHYPKRPLLMPPGPGLVKLYDGGENPFPEPQPMALLVLRPTHDRAQSYETYVRAGPPYVGFPLEVSEVAYSQRIFFP